jgi:hypothetical protein
VRNPKLSELSAGTPYHIINAAINIQRSTQNLRGRNAQSFWFSKLFCGSDITGWCETKSLQKVEPRIDLAAAMAISGAAVAPNQGVMTNRPLRFLMAISNARLGYWLVNPAKLSSGERVGGKVGLKFFLLELFGLLDEKRKLVYVSDGGHIENLGAYELIHRKCKFIVIVDSEQDTLGSFHGLAHLVRLAKIDFNYDIEFSMEDLQRNEFGFSKAHAALGYVRYSPSETGIILYIKSSVTGDENEYIKEYKKRIREFPHESTSDQFFTEEQFEAYRALGYHIGHGLADVYEGSIEEFFERLNDKLVIDVVDKDIYLDVQRRIMNVLRFMDSSLPESSEEHARANSGARLRHVLERKAQLMEHAVLKLKLNEPYIALGPCRNIIEVFLGWLGEPEFEKYWGMEDRRFGDELRRFIGYYSRRVG